EETYFTEDELAGFVLMNDQSKGNCLHCHTTDADALGTTAKFSNNGLDSAQTIFDYKDGGQGVINGLDADMGKFRIPSLRNVAVTPPYMHDGRFQTLKEVLDFYSEGIQSSVNVDSKLGFVHQGGAHLTEEEKHQIIQFLHAFTDSTLLVDPRYGNPFEE
ncbi:MAG: cytochrome-c peroxidase, partial [Bacteroidota bacterium]